MSNNINEKTYTVTITVDVKTTSETEALNDAVQYINELHDDQSLHADIHLASAL